MASRIGAPFNVGDLVEFKCWGSGYAKGLTAIVTAIGFDRDDKRGGNAPWRVKLSIEKTAWWSARWFKRAKAN